MAKQKGYIEIDGTLGGLTFYRSRGENFIKRKGGVEKSRIEKEAAFKRTRENMKEFGASATVGKALRQGLASIIKSMSDSSLVGRLTGVMKRINSSGPGIRGERAFEILNNKILLEGFEFNKTAPLDAIFYAPNTPPRLDANRNIATWDVPDFDTSNYIHAPEGATHFKLVLATTVLSDYTFDASQNAYKAVNEAENKVNGLAITREIALGGMVGSATTLTVDLGFVAALPATVGVVNAIGIVFYQEINTVFYELASDNAMRIDLVG